MKKSIIAMALLLSCGMLQAKPVDAATARRVAERVLGSTELVDRSPELQLTEIYLFAPADSQGFVLVSADDCALPVLGWSPTSVFRASVVPALSWLTSCARQISDMRQQGIEASEEVADQWSELLGGRPIAPKSSPIGPLVTTTWDQAPVYQQRCPYDAGANTRCLAGCGAIAMAQVMKYWNHPATGRGSNSYYTYTNNYGPLEANFDTAYAWSSMPNALTWANSQAEQAAVNQLIYHVGVSIEMDYTPNWSSSSIYYDDYYGPSVEVALVNYFKYRPTAHAVTISEYTTAEWKNLMMAELRAARPVVYRGADPQQGGHIFVLDGCDANGRFHFNWGWGGYADGYFAIGSLNTDNYTSWNEGNCAVIGIEPLTTDAATITVSGVSSNPAWGSVSGGGTFTAYDTVVSLLATAADGYRFDHWADGCINNPRRYVANESRADTAVFVSAGADTIGYCLPRYRWGYGYSGNSSTTYGAICLSLASQPAGHSLAAVQLYAASRGTYTINIHNGLASKPGPILFTQTFNVTESGQWVTLQFDSLVALTDGRPIWVAMRTDNIPYAVSVSRYGGMDKSFFFSGNGTTWYDVHTSYGYLSAMLRAIFVDPNPAAIDNVESDGIQVSINGLTVSAATTTADDLALYDLAGRLLCASHGSSLHFTVPAAGVYLLRVGEKSRKIILQ